MTHYEALIQKLDQFIRKYYVNKAIRGTLYSMAAIFGMFLIYSLLEYNYYFDQGVRKFMFYSFIGLSATGLIYWIGRPLLAMSKLGSRISHDQAAEIIGSHFAEVKDKLLNILQLKRAADSSSSPQLALASIGQKTEDLRPIQFKKAINLGENRKYLRYTLPPLMVILALLVAAPSVITDSTGRIIRNNEDFEREAPFAFIISEDSELSVEQYKDFDLNIRVEGAAIPDEVFIDIGDYQYRLKKDGQGEFSYRFRNVHQNMDFKLFAGPVVSKDYTLTVLKRPNLLSFETRLDYPSYTRRQDEALTNVGDLVVPMGTNISWSFNTLNTDKIKIRTSGEDPAELDQQGSDLFSTTEKALKDMSYTLYLSNDQLVSSDSVRYHINVIPDLYPKISVELFTNDSVDQDLAFFVGTAGDDYGVKALTFNYQLTEESGEQLPTETFPLSVQNGTQFQFDYTFDIREVALKPGQQISYYFEVFDNDAINGSKSTKSNILTYRKPTVEEFEEAEKANNDNIKQNLKNSLKESKKLQEDMQKMREKLLQEKDLEWQNKKELENLMERRNNLQQQLEQAQDLFQENMENQMEYEEPTPEQLEEQQKMEEFFEQLQNEEFQEMMEKLNEMMEEMKKEDALEMLEDFEFNEEELQKELDRLMELFKQMELEQELEQQIDKLNELAEQEEQLSEKTEQQEDGDSNDELQKEQEEIQEKFEEIKEAMEELQEKNEELETPKNMEAADEQEMDKIDQDMQNSQEQMQQQQNKKASESQKSASERMKQMAEQMSAQMQQGQMDQMQEDMTVLRQLLENLVTLSFDQEDVIDQLRLTNVATPRYVSLVQDQFKIQDDFKVVEDTLHELSKRVVQIESFVTEKVSEIKSNLDESIDQLEARKKSVAANHQQHTMTNLNDLALMLSEVMNQMQQQMSTMMPGTQMCNNPQNKPGQNPGKVPMDKITEGQQKLNQDMQDMKRGMQEGEKGSSEQFARMAARQAALRKALRDLAKEKQQRGQGDEALEQTIQQMDKIETELVNKQLTNAMLKRQQDILTRLLEAEKAEREREMDNKRKAETAQQIERQMPPAMEEYIKQREAEIESFQTVSPALRPYYKFLVEEYYDALKNQ